MTRLWCCVGWVLLWRGRRSLVECFLADEIFSGAGEKEGSLAHGRIDGGQSVQGVGCETRRFLASTTREIKTSQIPSGRNRMMQSERG